MQLGFGGFSNENVGIGYQGQNAESITDHNSRAILFVFKPYESQFGDVAMRPFQYQFDDNFLSATQEITDLTKSGSASNGALLNQFMSEKNFSDYMVSSYQPTMLFKSSQLSDKYRFILVLTEKASGLITGNTLASNVGSNQIRRIYTGYFEDEPFNPATLTHSNRTLNSMAFLVVTHKTVVGTATEHGMYGSRTSVNTRASEEVINSQVSSAYMAHGDTGDRNTYLMTPSNCINTMEDNGEGYVMSVPGAGSNLTHDRGQHMVADTLEQPTHNVAQIVKGMMKYQDDVTTRGRLMTGRVDSFYENDFLENSAAKMNLGRWMDIPRYRGGSMFDLDLDSRISVVDIDTMVRGDLEVVDFDKERPQFYDTADQTQQDMTNQYSHLISTVIGPILNAAGLNAMQFVYEVRRSRGQVQEQFNTISAEPHWTISPQETVLTAKSVEMELTKGIFATIFNSKGDFRVEVTANVTGMTVVRLDLIGQGCRSYADFELPTCLGGLISPLIGDARSNAFNSEHITGLYSAATGTATGAAGFNPDDHQFADFANQQFSALSGQLTSSDQLAGALYD